MSLSSSSTIHDAIDQFNDNLSWEGSPTKAKLALEAVRWILMNRPQNEGEEDGWREGYDTVYLRQKERELASYLNRVGTTGRQSRTTFARPNGL